VSTTGNVGIGTLTPSAKLDVNGRMVVDSMATFKDSLRVQKKLIVDQDVKIQGKSVFIGNGKFKNKLVIGGITRMNGDAKIFGDLKLKSLANLSLTQNRFLSLQPNGKVTSLGKSGLINAIYQPIATCLTTQNGNILPVWKQNPNPNYGILFTGTDCPARVGIGTDFPLARLDVRGRGLFSDRVGIGTNLPEDKLQVGGNVSKMVIGSAYSRDLRYGTSYIGFNASRKSTGIWKTSGTEKSNGGAVIYGDIEGNIRFSTIPSTGDIGQSGITDGTIVSNIRLFIHKGGNVGIGTTAINGYKLSVEGYIRAREIDVNLNTWADFVFYDDYQLKTLKQVEDYITKNKHLPDVPSEKEVLANGVSLGEMNVVLLQKIEELTLYMIAMNKRMELLEMENKSLKD